MSDWKAFALAMVVVVSVCGLVELVRFWSKAETDRRAIEAGYVQTVERGYVIWVKEGEDDRPIQQD